MTGEANPHLRRALLWLMATAPALVLGTQGAEAQPAAPRGEDGLPFALRTPVFCGEAALRVRQMERMVFFYRRTLGLAVLQRTPEAVVMGVAGTPLLRLLPYPAASNDLPSEAGLFHIAYLMPSRQELARWLAHVAVNRVQLTGFADHRVSEAIYLNDPEGNGIEVYSDRPRDTWQWQGGTVTMGTYQLDVQDILAMARDRATPYGEAPAAMRIGHMHLRVGDVATGRGFYQRALGLDSTRGDNPRAAFLASGGYHHHVAINSWGSAGAGRRDAQSSGLDWFSLMVRDPAELAAQRDRLRRAGFAPTEIEGGFAFTDPWGTQLRLRQA